MIPVLTVRVVVVSPSSVPTALRVNGPTNGLGVDGRPPLLSPSQVSLAVQSPAYRAAELGDSPGEWKCYFFPFQFYINDFFNVALTVWVFFPFQCLLP